MKTTVDAIELDDATESEILSALEELFDAAVPDASEEILRLESLELLLER